MKPNYASAVGWQQSIKGVHSAKMNLRFLNGFPDFICKAVNFIIE